MAVTFSDLPPRTRNTILLCGGALLAIGFCAGFMAGSAGAPPAAPATASAPMQPAPPSADGGGQGMGLTPAASGGLHYGHTFTGNVDTPPHTEQAHEMADKLLADVTCPCGCKNMTIAQCGCDASLEIAGVGAHLLERGNAGDAVLRKLQALYKLDVSPAMIAQAAPIRLANPQLVEGGGDASGDAPGASLPSLPADLGQLGQEAQSPVDVPTGARATSAPDSALAATVLDPSGFTAAAALSYRIAKRQPELLQQLVCGCGCRNRLGHASLLTCYQSAHAATCPICQAEAQEAERMASQGAAPAQIRAQLDKQFNIVE